MAPINVHLRAAQDSGLERLDAQVLMAYLVGRDRTWLHAHGSDTLLSPDQAERFRQLCAQRLQGIPVAYLTGVREFYGLGLHITPEVLDPRPDTEVLVDWALECLRGPLVSATAPVVADLGTGSGAVALAVAHHAPHAQVHGVDRSPGALRVALVNGERLGLNVRWHLGDWFTPLRGIQGDLVLSNPPYIADDDPHLPALHAEPREALVAADRGLANLRHLVEHSRTWLRPGGWLLLEHGHDQAAAVAECLRAAGYQDIGHRQDLAGHWRCSGGSWPGRVDLINPEAR